MIVKCKPIYDGDKGPKGVEAWPCGKVYDDAECSTICPHEPLGPKMTEAEQEAALKLMREGGFFDRPRAEDGDV